MSLSPSTPAGLRCQTRCKNNIPPSKPPYKYVGSQAKLKVCPPCSHSSQFGGALAGRNRPAATSTRRDGRGEVTAQAGRLPPAGFSAHPQLPWSSLSPHTLLPLGAARILSARRPPRPGRPHNNAADRPHQPHRPLPARLHRHFCACASPARVPGKYTRGWCPAHAQRPRRRPPRGRAEPPCGARRGSPARPLSLPRRGLRAAPAGAGPAPAAAPAQPPLGPSEPTAFPGEGAGRGLAGSGAARAELTIYGQRQGRAAGRAGASWFVPLGARG